ncbi:glycosyltransferase family 32 protein [Emericellopsis atlantica]|uniref:Glycosyltransferase family 32 protein n=1 Tax=Emericellopsis atlantica TaxID=2614577 RepID=A0A9P7ZVD0_9HYPO|nr:glycosyltransferase family 32 protein [Emericellopsis atlantica]KAG9258761.1 glycosyltransferase family 32 protein [Emericellopsis atlantica]
MTFLPRQDVPRWQRNHVGRRRIRVLRVSAGVLLMLSVWWLSHDYAMTLLRSTTLEDEAIIEISPVSMSLIPPRIWQIMFPKAGSSDPITPDQLGDTASWLALNPDFSYTLIGPKGANDLILEAFPEQPQVVKVFEDLPNVAMKSDLLRYGVLHTHGGVYTDTDTVAIRGVDQWIPADIRDQVRLVVGIEYDRRDDRPWPGIFHWVQFCQWTIAAAPGHPVFEGMIARALRSIMELANQGERAFVDLHLSTLEVMNSTGPAAWTEIVFEHLQAFDPSLNTTADLSYMEEPTLFGDILVLPIDGFGMGQQHSHSSNDGSVPSAALARHLFRGSWKDDW